MVRCGCRRQHRGVCLAFTFIASVPALAFYDSVLNDADHILGSGADARVSTGAARRRTPSSRPGTRWVAVHDATFLLGPAFCAGFGNGILLGYLMYRSCLAASRCSG